MEGFSIMNVTYVQRITDVDLASLNFMNKCYLEGVNFQPSADSGNLTATDT
jgi:hypothetical protein